ncbi:hypothetical protein BJF85_15650 [Saccharomonospora sp. CUA-673]|uniref:hypothetical protein n=1 Tax=Saccharomonospora sp. CUA-673 TaxID=1904969 RepID=UPI00095E7B20|nr:hypothetical protein [Saccharomonospora sp. CUA-673]OLT47591.1 hypothetical protein BJF85_15650 [Saccharomonospora sp. CUA-673]
MVQKLAGAYTGSEVDTGVVVPLPGCAYVGHDRDALERKPIGFPEEHPQRTTGRRYFPRAWRRSEEPVVEALSVENAQTDVEVVLLVTGFHTHHFLDPVRIAGRSGATLAETWAQRTPTPI